VEGVRVSVQLKGLADGCERILYGPSADLNSSAKFSLPDPLSENLHHSDAFFSRKVLKVRVKMGPNEVFPMPPITLVLLVVCHHHAIGDAVVRSKEKIFPHVVLGRVHSSQDAPCGSGKVEPKWVRKL